MRVTWRKDKPGQSRFENRKNCTKEWRKRYTRREISKRIRRLKCLMMNLASQWVNSALIHVKTLLLILNLLRNFQDPNCSDTTPNWWVKHWKLLFRKHNKKRTKSFPWKRTFIFLNRTLTTLPPKERNRLKIRMWGG